MSIIYKPQTMAALGSPENSVEKWDAEYSHRQVIPSTTSCLPSRSLQIYRDLLKFDTHRQIIDLGSGNCRNAIYLARLGNSVTAVDYCCEANALARNYLRQHGLTEQVELYNSSVLDELPFSKGSFDIALDFFVSCHFSERERTRYLGQMAGLLNVGGFFISAVVAVDDEYYAQFDHETRQAKKTVIDPNNGIRKWLFSESELRNLFSTHFNVKVSNTLRFTEQHAGSLFLRSTVSIVAQKR